MDSWNISTFDIDSWADDGTITITADASSGVNYCNPGNNCVYMQLVYEYGGSSYGSFYNLKVGKDGSGKVVLNDDITIQNELQVPGSPAGGGIEPGDYIISLPGGSLLSRDEESPEKERRETEKVMKRRPVPRVREEEAETGMRKREDGEHRKREETTEIKKRATDGQTPRVREEEETETGMKKREDDKHGKRETETEIMTKDENTTEEKNKD